MPGTNVYDRFDTAPTKKRDLGETAQIVVLSGIILVFFAIAASSAMGLIVSAMHH
jgi:hypothetical protein